MFRLLTLFLLIISILSAQIGYVKGDLEIFALNVALGKVPGWEIDFKFGVNPEVDSTGVDDSINATNAEDIWRGGDDYTGFPEPCPAEKLEVFSSDANDTSAGSGMQTITIHLLDDSKNRVTETLSLNGLTGVQTASNGCRASRAFGATFGSGGTSAGNITIRNVTTTANVYAQIPAGYNQTQIAAYTVPNGYTMIVLDSMANIVRSSGAAGSASVVFMARLEGSNGFRVRDNYLPGTEGPIAPTYLGWVFPEKTDVKMRIFDISDNSTIVVGRWQYFLVEN